MTLTKADLVQNVYQKHELTKAQAAEAVEVFLQIARIAWKRAKIS